MSVNPANTLCVVTASKATASLPLVMSLLQLSSSLSVSLQISAFASMTLSLCSAVAHFSFATRCVGILDAH